MGTNNLKQNKSNNNFPYNILDVLRPQVIQRITSETSSLTPPDKSFWELSCYYGDPLLSPSLITNICEISLAVTVKIILCSVIGPGELWTERVCLQHCVVFYDVPYIIYNIISENVRFSSPCNLSWKASTALRFWYFVLISKYIVFMCCCAKAVSLVALSFLSSQHALPHILLSNLYV